MAACVEVSMKETRELSSTTAIRGHVVVGKYLLDSIEKKKQGDESNYQWILSQLKAKNMTDTIKLRWLTVLKKNVTHLNDEQIIKAVLDFSWANCGDELVDMYTDYLCDLTSVYPHLLPSVLHSILTVAISPDYTSDCLYNNIHRAINLQLQLISNAPSCLITTLESLAPYKGKPSNYQEVFVRCCLHICQYYSNLSNELLHLVILKMLQIDVEVLPVEEEEEVKKEDVLENEQFEMDTDESKEEEKVETFSLRPCLSFHGNMNDKMADSIDVLMCVLFEFIDTICFMEGQLILDSACSLFKSFIKIFFQQIFITPGSRHVQFLLFKLASYEQSFSDYFLDALWKKVQDVSVPALLRQVAVGYISSFLARANFLPLRCVVYYLSAMVKWIHQYLETKKDELLRPDIGCHSVWYAVCQGMMYIVVFHHKALLEMENGQSFLRGMNFERIISSKLNPMKVCLSSVVNMFAKMTSKYEIVFCYTIIEENKRLFLPSVTTHTQSSVVLEVIFPFDPYHLKRSSKFITGLYRTWDHSCFTSDEDNNTIERETKRKLPCESLEGGISSSLESFSLN